MTVGNDHDVTGLDDLVVGLDGSAASAAALRWSVAQVGPAGRVHAVRVVDADADTDALDDELRGTWIPDALDVGSDGRSRTTVDAVVLTGDAPGELVRYADRIDAGAVVVGHHAHARFGPRLVGHVTATLLHEAERPVVVVPTDWEPARTDGRPVAVGVGVAAGTETAVRWAIVQPAARDHGLLLVHALGPRTVFRPDGWLDVLAYHLDPTVLTEWVEQDLFDLADRIGDETGVEVDVDVDVTVSVRPGRTGARLVEAGAGAGMLVVGRGEPAFVRSHAIAPYLRHAILHATCPVVVVPVE